MQHGQVDKLVEVVDSLGNVLQGNLGSRDSWSLWDVLNKHVIPINLQDLKDLLLMSQRSFILLFLSNCFKQLTTWHHLFESTHSSSDQKYWNV